MDESKTTWLVALGAGGEIIAAERGAPTAWRGARFDEQEGVPGSLREGARVALEAWKQSPTEMTETSVEVPELGVVVKLVVLPAVGMRRTPTDVRALFVYAMAALEKQARALDIALSVETSDEVPHRLWLDPEKVAWAVTALVGNSLRHVKRGTRMRPGGAIGVSAKLENTDLVIRVTDDGPGMPDAIVKRLFQRAPGAPHATGLALTVVRDVIHAHGGSLEVTSSVDEVDHGTTVTVRLPAG